VRKRLRGALVCGNGEDTDTAQTLLGVGYTRVAGIPDSFKGWLQARYAISNRQGEFVLLPNGSKKKE
jgi:hypothetical protein